MPLFVPCILDDWLAEKCGTDTGNPVATVREEQLARLRAQLDYARAYSRFYREHLKNIPGGIFFWDDLPSLPFTETQDILDWKRFLCVSQNSVERIVTLESSGTSGSPKRLAFSYADLAATKDFFRIGMAQLVQKGDRALVLWPGAQRPYGVSALLCEALNEKGVTAFTGDPQTSVDSLHREIASYNPHVVIAAPQQLAPLVKLFSSKGVDAGRFALRGILSSAESLPPELARILRSRCGMLVLDHYGMTETGYGGGVECPAHDGYHLRELDILFEIVAIESGLPLPDGQEGEIVITTLTREAMPLIRYRTGDVASVLPGPCRCGSPVRRLSSIKGRIVRKNSAYTIENLSKGSFCERTVHASL